MSNKTEEPKYRCTRCKGTHVYAEAWIGVNDPNDILGPYQETHCEDCQGDCNIEEIN